LLAAATGTALALLDQQDTLKRWWLVLPGYIDEVQRLLNQTQSAVEEFSAQRQKLGSVLGRDHI
jgi:diadenosine tetraphosphate (Ap4A) HIT family hydrolase